MKALFQKLNGFALCLFVLAVSAANAQESAVPKKALLEVPRLAIVLSCGDCKVAPTVPDLISDAYMAAATQAGMAISDKEEAVLSIMSYSQRPPGARAMFGAFAGKDEIKAVVKYGEKTFEVEDYFRNGWQGMNALSKNIGEMTLDKIIK